VRIIATSSRDDAGVTGTTRSPSSSRRIVIVGNGIAAWMAAAALARAVRLEDWSICVVHASGEDRTDRFADATLPFPRNGHVALALDEDRIVRDTGGAFSFGIALCGWSGPDATYFHSFGQTGASLGPVAFQHVVMRLRSEGVPLRLADYSMAALAAQAGRFRRPGADPRSVLSTCRYGLHLDCEKASSLFMSQAEAMGVETVADAVAGVELADDGTIASIRTERGKRIGGDLFLDCTGTDAQLIGELGNGRWEDWSAWLPCDSFVSARSATKDAPPPYSIATATRSGWIRRLPLQGADWLTGIHSREYCGPDEALDALRRSAGRELDDVRTGPMRFGRRTRAWQRNCVALGASAVLLDPVATSNLQLLCTAIDRLLKLLPAERSAWAESAEYNRLTALEQDHARDFAILHYKLNRRYGEGLWDACRTMPIPETLEYKCRSYESRGRIALYDEEPLEEASWLNLFDEHGVHPRHYSPIADGFTIDELENHCKRVRAIMIEELVKMPSHGDYLSSRRSA
jgi:tryptophan halogenase